MPAQAELEITYVNRGYFEVINIYQKYDSGSQRDDVRLAPDHETTYVVDDASQLKRVGMDAGVMYYKFNNMSKLDGRTSMKLEITLDADNRPHLTLDGKNIVKKGGTFELEAGPLWSGDHAEQQCPQALQHWLDLHLGVKAKWTGEWKPATEDHASICLVEVTDDGGEPVDLGGTPVWLSAAGKGVFLVSPDETKGTPLDDVLQAKSMDELRALGAKESPTRDKDLLLTARFAGRSWAAVATPGKDDDGIKKISLRAFTKNGLVADTLAALAKKGYRPWHMQIGKGQGKEDQQYVQFKTAYPALDKARAFVLKQCRGVEKGKTPAVITCVLIPEEAYASLMNAGSHENIPAFVLKQGGKMMLILDYVPDARVLLDSAQ